ncbi:hypothetical protein Tco_0973116 [Tanacetum coccineum]
MWKNLLPKLYQSLEEFKQPEFEGYGVKVNKSVSEYSSNKIKKTSGTLIIEDWGSDCDEDETLEKVSESANVQKPKQADQPRKISQNPRNNSTNWNTPMSKKFGVGFSVFLQSWQSFRREAAPVKVNTVKVNFVNTAKGKRVISAVGEQGINAAKSTACWVWRPKIKVLDHVSKNNGSYICKQFDYVDPTDLEFKGYLIYKGYADLMKMLELRGGYYKKELAIPGQTTTVVTGCTIVKIPILGDVDASTRFVGDSASKCPMIHLLREVTPWIDEGIQKLNELTNLLSTEDLLVKALWVELKRLFEPDKDDVLWKLQRYMHDPLTWRLYGSCVVNCSYRIDARQKVASRRR